MFTFHHYFRVIFLLVPEETDLSEILPAYHALASVFSKQKAISLLPHRPYECNIDLLPGTPLPSSRLYNLLGPEKETTRKYIVHFSSMEDFLQSPGSHLQFDLGVPHLNGQTERCNQELESDLRCVSENNPATWSQHLPWVEYAHNSQTSSATGLSPFEASLGYCPPLFPTQDSDICVPSVQHHLCCGHSILHQTKAALLQTAEQYERFAD